MRLKIPRRYLEEVNQNTYKIIPKKLKRKKMSKGTNNDLQNTTQKTKDYVTPTPLKSCGTLMCSGRVNSSNCSTNGTHHDTPHRYAYICILYNDFSLFSFSM